MQDQETMLFILFQIGNDRYALEARQVVEVLPLLELKRIPNAPRGVAGLFIYRGQPVMALDLSELTQGQPSREQLSTRIILIQCPDTAGNARLVGLVAERATEMLRKAAAEFMNPGARISPAPYLGPVFMDESGPVQWVHEQRLLTDPMRRLLAAPLAEAGGELAI